MKKITRQSTLRAFSNHAKTRCRQRGIPEEIAAILVESGTPWSAPGGATIYKFDKLAKNSADKEELMTMDRYSTVYAVVSGEGRVITVGHQAHGFGRKLH